MGVMKVHNAVSCESGLISKRDISYKLWVYNAFCESHRQNTTLALAECGMGKVIVHAEFSRQGDHRYLQQMQFFAHWFRDLLPLFSLRELIENSPISLHALISGHTMTEKFVLI
jgi:hypothetical protein